MKKQREMFLGWITRKGRMREGGERERGEGMKKRNKEKEMKEKNLFHPKERVATC